MDDPTQKKSLGDELDELLADTKRERQESSVRGKVLIAKADQLASELEKTNFSDLRDAEKNDVKDLNVAAAEEIASLEEEEASEEE